MNYIYRTDIVLAAVDAYLEQNATPKDAPYTREVQIYDEFVGWQEQILRAAVMPQYVSLEQDDFEILSDYLKEV